MNDQERLQEILEEHKPNLEVLEHISSESFKNLYCTLVADLCEALEGESE